MPQDRMAEQGAPFLSLISCPPWMDGSSMRRWPNLLTHSGSVTQWRKEKTQPDRNGFLPISRIIKQLPAPRSVWEQGSRQMLNIFLGSFLNVQKHQGCSWEENFPLDLGHIVHYTVFFRIPEGLTPRETNKNKLRVHTSYILKWSFSTLSTSFQDMDAHKGHLFLSPVSEHLLLTGNVFYSQLVTVSPLQPLDLYGARLHSFLSHPHSGIKVVENLSFGGLDEAISRGWATLLYQGWVTFTYKVIRDRPQSPDIGVEKCIFLALKPRKSLLYL